MTGLHTRCGKRMKLNKTRARARKQNVRTSGTTGDDLVDRDKEYRKLVTEGLNAECKVDIVVSNYY